MAPAESRSCVSGGRESKEASENKAKSSPSSSSPSLESTISEYFASLTGSPETKCRKQETEIIDVKRKLEESGMLRLVLDSIEDSPDTNRRRNAEDSEISTRRLAENRRLERELRQQEVKASRAVQEGSLRPIVMPTKNIDEKLRTCAPQFSP